MITVEYDTHFGTDTNWISFKNLENNKNVSIKTPFSGKSFERQEFSKLIDALKDLLENERIETVF